MAGPHRWQPGESGNPAGRAPRARDLTAILRKAGDELVEVNGKKRRVKRKVVLARLIWQGVSTGLVTFPDSSTIEIKGQAWLDLLKWLYRHIEGDAPVMLQVEEVGRYELAANAVRLAIAGHNGDDSAE